MSTSIRVPRYLADTSSLSETGNQHRHAVLKRHNVQIIGKDKPTMIFCNGFGCNQHIWRHMMPALAADYQLVMFDHVGSGDSDLSAYKPDKYATLNGYAQDIVEICQVLDLQQTIIVAHSVGSMIALLAASQAPAHFSKLIMVAPSPCYINDGDYYGGFEREDVEQLLGLMETDYDSWANLFAQLLMGPCNTASLSQEMAGYFCQTNTTVAKQFARVAFLADNRAEVPYMQLPTLILQCSQDVAAPAEVGAYLHQHLPQSTLVNLQAMGHCPHLSAPLETLEAIHSYLHEPAAVLAS